MLEPGRQQKTKGLRNDIFFKEGTHPLGTKHHFPKDRKQQDSPGVEVNPQSPSCQGLPQPSCVLVTYERAWSLGWAHPATPGSGAHCPLPPWHRQLEHLEGPTLSMCWERKDSRTQVWGLSQQPLLGPRDWGESGVGAGQEEHRPGRKGRGLLTRAGVRRVDMCAFRTKPKRTTRGTEMKAAPRLRSSVKWKTQPSGGWRGTPPHLGIVNNGCDGELRVSVDELPHLGLHVLLAQVPACGLKQRQK